MRKAFLVQLGLAAAAVFGFGAVCGWVLRQLEPAGTLKPATEAWVATQSGLDGMRGALWEARTVFGEFLVSRPGVDAAAWDLRFSKLNRTLKERLDEAGSALAGEAQNRLLRQVTDAVARVDSTRRTYAALRARTPETADLFRAEAADAFRSADRALDELQAGAVDALKREHSRVVLRVAQVKGAGWLLILPAAALVAFFVVARPGAAAPVTVIHAESVAEAVPEPTPEDGLAFLEKTFGASAEDPVLAATSGDAGGGMLPIDLLNLAFTEADWIVMVLDPSPDDRLPVLRWSTENLARLGATLPPASLVGKSLEESLPGLREVLQAAFKTIEPGKARRSEADLGSKEKPLPCEMVLVQTGDLLGGGRMLAAIRPLAQDQAQRVLLEEARAQIVRLEEKIRDTVQAKGQVEEKRRDLAKVCGGLPFEFEVKPDNKTIVCTDLPNGFAEMHGLKIDDFFMDGNALTKHVARADRPKVEEAFAKALADLSVLDVSYGIVTKDGVEKWFRLRGVPRKTAEGWTRFLATLEDRTVLQKASEALTASTVRVDVLEAALEAMDRPVYCLDGAKGWQFFQVNAKAAEHFGYSAADLAQVQIGNVDAGFEAALAVQPEGSVAFVLEGTHETANGPMPVKVEYTPVTTKEGGRYLVGRLL